MYPTPVHGIYTAICTLLLIDYRARIIPKDGLEEIMTTGRGSGPFILKKPDNAGTTVLGKEVNKRANNFDEYPC